MTFHIRLVSPGDLTEQLVEVLLADSGVSNVVMLTGSARRPDGDAVGFDVLARSAKSVLRQLEAFAGTGAGRSPSSRWMRPSANRLLRTA